MIHCLDGYEDHSRPWLPDPSKEDISASVIFAAQAIPGQYDSKIPTFGCNNGGLIFRPGVTKVRCGAPGDCGGHCLEFCDAPSYSGKSVTPSFPGDDCKFHGVADSTRRGTWRTAHIGAFLKKVTTFQHDAERSFYNEIIVDGNAWRSHADLTIEAIFDEATSSFWGDNPQVNSEVADVHAQFLAATGLDPATNPLLRLDRSNWDAPFSIAASGE